MLQYAVNMSMMSENKRPSRQRAPESVICGKTPFVVSFNPVSGIGAGVTSCGLPVGWLSKGTAGRMAPWQCTVHNVKG